MIKKFQDFASPEFPPLFPNTAWKSIRSPRFLAKMKSSGLCAARASERVRLTGSETTASDLCYQAAVDLCVN